MSENPKFQKDQLISYKMHNGRWYIGYFLYWRSYECFEIATPSGTYVLSERNEGIEWCFGVSSEITDYSYA